MKFPHPIEPNDFEQKMILNLEFNFRESHFIREYYLVTYQNGNELIFMTSNELDAFYDQLYLREDFFIFFDSHQIIKDFSNIPFMDIYMSGKYHIPLFPYYLYYKPLVVDRRYIDIFKYDLIANFDKDQLPKEDYFINNLNHWTNILDIEL